MSSAAPPAARREELYELLAIPSISGDPRHADDLRYAVAWVCGYLERCGGIVERTEWEGRPLGVIRLSASHGPASAPTLMLYGHVDVQPAGDDRRWTSPPFEPTERGGWLYARGAADNKGPFYAMLAAVGDLAAANALPADVLVVCDAEEEVGGRSVAAYLRQERPAAHACIVFDSSMLGARRPAFTVATRGVASFRARVTTNARDLHSGSFGGAALNAANVLVAALAPLTERGEEPFRSLEFGVEPLSEAELERLAELDGGAAVLAGQGAVPADDEVATGDFYRRVWAAPAFDVHSLSAGVAETEQNVVLHEAAAIFSLRVAPGQDVEAIGASVRRFVESRIPAGATLELVDGSRTPAAGPFDTSSRLYRAAGASFRDAFGCEPLFVRSGGSLPILAPLAELGIEPLVTGLDVPDGNIHAPDERLLLDHLERGIAAVRGLVAAWGAASA